MLLALHRVKNPARLSSETTCGADGPDRADGADGADGADREDRADRAQRAKSSKDIGFEVSHGHVIPG